MTWDPGAQVVKVSLISNCWKYFFYFFLLFLQKVIKSYKKLKKVEKKKVKNLTFFTFLWKSKKSTKKVKKSIKKYKKVFSTITDAAHLPHIHSPCTHPPHTYHANIYWLNLSPHNSPFSCLCNACRLLVCRVSSLMGMVCVLSFSPFFQVLTSFTTSSSDAVVRFSLVQRWILLNPELDCQSGLGKSLNPNLNPPK